MAAFEFYSDRTRGPASRDRDVLTEATARGLLNLVQSKIDGNWFAKRFPDQCYDKQGVTGTVDGAVEAEIQALIPDLQLPLSRNADAPGDAIFDLLEYAARYVSEPSNGRYHSGLKHHELNFDDKSGRTKFRDEANQILARGRTTYELASSLEVQRTGTPEVRKALADLKPDSGDPELDKLVTDARDLYMSHKSSDRKIGIEKLWDAFERLKTIEIPNGDKRRSVTQLLDHISNGAFRVEVEAEMLALTKIGNAFNIRHHETGKHAVPVEGYDYLFSRMSALIILLLRESDRLA